MSSNERREIFQKAFTIMNSQDGNEKRKTGLLPATDPVSRKLSSFKSHGASGVLPTQRISAMCWKPSFEKPSSSTFQYFTCDRQCLGKVLPSCSKIAIRELTSCYEPDPLSSRNKY